MDKDTIAMAGGNYGYGRWDARYWFVGLEQGMANPEGNDLVLRVKVWLELDSCELNDCREFHRRIGEMRWHFKKPKVDLQQTWRPLMLLLMTFLERPADNNDLRYYQAHQWGDLDKNAGETCVIELSGLAAPNMQEAEDTEPFLKDRIKFICDKIRKHQPELVVMYGTMQNDSWNAIARAVAGRDFPPDGSAPVNLPKTSVLLQRPTTLVRTPHPVSYGLSNDYWTGLGTRLRDLAERLGVVP